VVKDDKIDGGGFYPPHSYSPLSKRLMRRFLFLPISTLLALLSYSDGGGQSCYAQYVTLAGTLSSSNGMPAANYLLSFTPSQMGFIGGTGVVINTATYCATSTDGSVVGVPNPLTKPSVSTGFTGTLPPGNYYAKFGFYDASGNLTLVSPETVIQLNSTGRLLVASPLSGMPAGAVGMKVYLATSTNAETLQGSTTGSAAFIQSLPLTAGASPPATNTTTCTQVANDAIWPSGTGYTVALTDSNGNTLPGYPMQWQLMGPNTTINLSTGLPYYHGTVYFPTPILASPLSHNLQSIAGPLSLSGYNLTNVAALGFGTSLPAWPIDVEDGFINSNLGYLVGGSSGTAGQCLQSGGSAGPDTWGPCSTTPTLYYQMVAANGTAQTQRPALNFTPRLAVTDSSSPAQTTVDLAAIGTAGTYTLPSSITTDSYGRVTSVTSGGGGYSLSANLTGSRAFGGVYQNTSTTKFMDVYVTEDQESGVGSGSLLTGYLGPTSLSQSPVANTGVTNSGGMTGVYVHVPPGWWYSANYAFNGGTPTVVLYSWYEGQ